LSRGWIQSPGQALIRRSALDAIGGFDAGIWGTDDWDLWLRLARRGEFCYCPRISLRYRLHEANASRNFVRMYRNGLQVVAKHSWS
jgi:GT2 family glycosyltransferase